jgi:putative oxidoreductase
LLQRYENFGLNRKKDLMKALTRLYSNLILKLGKLSWLPPLLARIALGVIFAESGWGKLHNIDKVAEFFLELHLPAPVFQAHLVAYTELFAGILVFLGLFTRIASVSLLITMTVAILTAKIEEIQQTSDLFAMSEFLYILLFIYLIIEGAGKVSLDYLGKKKLNTLS